MLLPFVSMLSSSLKTDPEIQHVPPTLLPHEIQWQNYKDAMSSDNMNLGVTLPNTIVVTICCVVGQILSSCLVGYGFARFQVSRRNAAVSS